MNKNKFLLYFVIYHALRISFFTPDKEVRIGLQSDVWHATPLLRRVAGNSYLLSSLPTHEFVLLSGCPLKHKAPPPLLAWRDICFIHLLFSGGCPESLAPQKTRNGLRRPSASPTRLTPVPRQSWGNPIYLLLFILFIITPELPIISIGFH